ncbi:FHA domain-containing protein [Azonexus sp.]|uniref:FHA domain-containing protein n=1 Tax=Azonexus sp. TaxID=1872668 RepID=UPI0039E324B0
MSEAHTASIFMIADITGSASLHQRLNDQEAERAIDRCLKRVTRSIEGQNGRIQQVVGDELLARFSQAEAACHAAIDMQQRVADLPPISGHKLSLRIALATAGEAAQLESDRVTQALRLAALAGSGEIVCDAVLGKHLQGQHNLHFSPLSERRLAGEQGGFPPFKLAWPHAGSSLPPADLAPVFDENSRLCLRYQEQIYLVNAQLQVLNIGRDTSCNIIADDRRISRHHARIERRSDGFYLVDTSTNGSFLSMRGRQEILVRRHDVLLEGSGKICLGSTINDVRAQCLEFEHL